MNSLALTARLKSCPDTKQMRLCNKVCRRTQLRFVSGHGFIRAEKASIENGLQPLNVCRAKAGRIFSTDHLRRRIVLTLNMNTIVQHLWEAIRFENALTLDPIFDTERPIRSTGDMLPWYTG